MGRIMKLKKLLAATAATVVFTALISFSGAHAEDNSRGSGGENKSNSNNSSQEFKGSGTRSHGHPVANLMDAPAAGSNQDSNSFINNDDANAELNWQQWNKVSSKATAKAVGQIAASPIIYHSTGVLHAYSGNVQIIPVWVGAWDANRKANWNAVLGNLITSLNSGSINTLLHVFNTNLGYFTGLSTPTLSWPGTLSNNVSATGTVKNSLIQVSDANVASYINTALNSIIVIKGAKPIYVYLGASNTRLSSGFGTAYCGWHAIGTVGTTNIPYIAIQDFNYTTYGSACSAQSVSPNSDAPLDAMASVLVHEIDEALTDPDLKTWYDSRGAENADKCAWTFGTTQTLTGGAKYNTTLGGKNYLIQRNWLSNNVVTGTDGTACVTANP